MGSSTSKASRAAGNAVRKYPTRSPNVTSRPPPSAQPSPAATVGPTTHPVPQASGTKTEAIDLDGRDPALASRLSTIGAVQPNPHYSATSTSSYDPQRNPSATDPSEDYSSPPINAFPDPRENPALRALRARQRIQEEADEEVTMMGRRGFEGRKYVDVGLVSLALTRRRKGEPDARIEESLGIKKGRLAALGSGIVDSI
ncbi:hypothetical protein BDV96DRAFT_244517 [Lophiotrema nucula]|uniref:Helix-turn-helix domain-containing protein n=1 Tax=Lophiotrema nucula TaxID=690887 RepID=A0A6A5YT17_9PLEO|nr:hypothetical protein BDV96DRAFT_244517 [Lophiotrema nucula]